MTCATEGAVPLRKGSVIPEIPQEYKKFKKQMERGMKKQKK